MTTVVSDTFTRADAGSLGTADTGQAWGVVQSAGSGWAISGNKAKATAVNNSIIALESGVSDCTVSVEVNPRNDQACLAWRVTDENNFWIILPLYNSVYKKESGSFVQVYNTLVPGTGVGTWSVVLNGDTIDIQMNGATQTIITDPFNATATKHGLYANDTTTTFDSFLVTTPGAGINIAPNDTNIVYSPYTWDVTAVRAVCNNAGAYLRALIQGSATAITANFDVSALLGNFPQLWYRVDDGPWTKTTVAATVALTMPTSTTGWGVHLVELVVKGLTLGQNRWSSAATQVKFTGFSTTPTTATTRAITTRSLKVVMFGDSNTEGVLTIKAAGGTPELDAFDVMQCWSWRLTETLGAEVGVVGFAGQGWDVASSGVPRFADAWGQLNSATARSFSPTPDLVVIAHGQNDITGDVSAVVTSTLNAILAATPTTTRIAVVRPITGTQAANIQAGIAECTTPRRVSYVDTTGWWSAADSSDGSHPWGYAHVGSLSPRLAAALRTVLARGAGYINVGGSAKAVTGVRA